MRNSWVVFKQQNVLALTFLNFCQSLGGGWYNWFPLFLEQQQGFDLASTGAIFALGKILTEIVDDFRQFVDEIWRF